jgi:serine/threonine-protein kinase
MQTPDAGVETKRGRSISLVVSAGLDLKMVPQLAGLTARQAQLDAEAAGFAVSRVGEVHTESIERGRVVGTMPRSGSLLPAGSGITMVVSLGPRPLELVMPSLVGRTPEEARLIAEELGLVVRSVRYDRGRSDVLRDVVVVQEPVAGARIVEGEGVTLRVGKG